MCSKHQQGSKGHIVRKTIKGHTYLYLYRSVRKGKKVYSVFVKYLGPADRFVHSHKMHAEKPTTQSGTSIHIPMGLTPEEKEYLESAIKDALEDIQRMRELKNEERGLGAGKGRGGEKQ